MPYADVEDVNALVPQAPFSDSSRPTAVQVAVLLAQVSRRIDATIGNVGYVVPVVSGDNGLALLRELTAWGALGLAQQSRETGASVAVTDKGPAARNIWTRLFEDQLEKLVDGQDPFELPDAPRTSEQLLKQGERVLLSGNADQDVDTALTRDQVL